VLLRRKRRDARLQVASQTEFFESFCESQSENVAAWSALVEAWEDSGMDGSVQNPYSREEEGDTEIDIRLKYAQEEAQSTAYLHEVTPSAFIMLGLDIEEQQRRLRLDLKPHGNETPLQRTSIAERRAKILRLISKFRSAQHIHNPLVFAMISQLPDTDTPAPPAEEAQLYLPSGLSHELRCHPDMKQWVDMETDYRRAQLRSSLEGIRTHLFVQTRLYSQKSIHIRHQKANTRARAIIDRNRRKIDELQQKYSAGWAALKVMVGESFIGFKQLRPEDVVSYNDPDAKAVRNVRRALKRTHDGSQVVQPGESTRMLSWIWAGVDTSEDSAVMKDALRVEWCKSQARFRRWVEELQLLQEEMDRTTLSLEAEAAVWSGRAEGQEQGPVGEGNKAYCLRQAAIRRGLAAKFRALWALPDAPVRLRQRKQLVEIPVESSSGSDSE
ncbi:hypothetical protein V5O48_008620, partial [Marasmius crinis-equi]